MVSRRASPAVTGATFPGKDSAQITRTPNSAAPGKSTPVGLWFG